MRSAFLDTGPIVAMLWSGDKHHKTARAAVAAAARGGRPACTTWEIIGEAYTLIRVRFAPLRSAAPALAVLRWAREGNVALLSTSSTDHDRAGKLLETYTEHRLSYVDALSLATVERYQVEELITVDRAHFETVRLAYGPTVTVV